MSVAKNVDISMKRQVNKCFFKKNFSIVFFFGEPNNLQFEEFTMEYILFFFLQFEELNNAK